MTPFDAAAPALSVEHRAALCRESFELFARAAFAALHPGTRFQPAPYLSFLCAKLQALADGEGQNLIVTLPPRGLKSFLVSVAFPAWLLGLKASRQVMAVSYAQSLADTHGRDRNKLMRSAFYRSVFGDVLTPTGSARRVATADRGGIFATGIDGSATGIGADYLIFDDPQNAQEALSEQVRTSTNRQFEQTFLSRRNDPLTASVLIVMQRLDVIVRPCLRLSAPDRAPRTECGSQSVASLICATVAPSGRRISATMAPSLPRGRLEAAASGTVAETTTSIASAAAFAARRSTRRERCGSRSAFDFWGARALGAVVIGLSMIGRSVMDPLPRRARRASGRLRTSALFESEVQRVWLTRH